MQRMVDEQEAALKLIVVATIAHAVATIAALLRRRPAMRNCHHDDGRSFVGNGFRTLVRRGSG
jgi:hypothetical protein